MSIWQNAGCGDFWQHDSKKKVRKHHDSLKMGCPLSGIFWENLGTIRGNTCGPEDIL
jgi:hypothetical protein